MQLYLPEKVVKLLFSKYGFILSVFLFITTSSSFSQDQLNKRYTIEFKDTPFKDVMNRLSSVTSLNFCYSAAIVPHSATVTGKFTNETLDNILSAILKKYSIEFSYANNQLILKKIAAPVERNTKIPEPKNIVKIVDTIKFTVPVYDTVKLLVTDTVRVRIFDTITHYDTIIVKKEEKKPQAQPRNIQSDKGKWLFSAYASYGLGLMDYNLTSHDSLLLRSLNKNLSDASSYSVNAGGIVRYKDISLWAGIGFTEYKLNFNYLTTRQGGYYRTDTISKFYAGVNGADTTWVYITEQKWVETEDRVIYETPQVFRYINLPLQIGYLFAINKKWSIEAKAGASFRFLFQNKGYSLVATDSTGVKKMGEDGLKLNSILISYRGSICISRKVNDAWMFFVESSFEKNSNSVFASSSRYQQYQTNYGFEAGFIFLIK